MSSTINAGLLKAYKQGVLLSASILITGDAVDDALGIYQDCPNLGIALHINLDEVLGFDTKKFKGKSISDIDRVRSKQLSHRSQEISKLIDEQLRKALMMGFTINHIDGHHHAHLFPGVLECTVKIAKQYGIHSIRFFDSFYEDQSDVLLHNRELLSRENIRYPDFFIDFSNLRSLSMLPTAQSGEIMVHLAENSLSSNNWRNKQLVKLLSSEFRQDLFDTRHVIASFDSIQVAKNTM